MHNEFLKIASSPLMNLDHTYRYSGTKLVEAESLSQHITDTIMMGLKIIDKMNSIAGKQVVDPAEYLMKAVYHDLEEVITGDIPRPLKYYNAATLESMRDVADQVAYEFFDREFYCGGYHHDIWESAKEGKAGYILKLVDTLVVANKVVKEVSLLNNFYMLRVAHEVKTYLQEQFAYMTDHVSDIYPDERLVHEYLYSLLDGAILAVTDILYEHRECMEKLNIAGMSMI